MLYADRDLPPKYKRVEYIGGTGTQYIDSGIECTSDLSVDFAASVQSDVNAAMCGGIRMGTIWRHHFSPHSNSDGTFAMYYFGTNSPAMMEELIINQVYRCEVNAQSGISVITWGNNRFQFTHTTIANATTGKGYGILARITNAGAIQSRPSRVYYFKFYRNGQMIGNFIPCVRSSDDTPGMYDTVTKAFFTNAGTGDILIPT